MLRKLLFFILALFTAFGSSAFQKPTIPDAARLQLMLKKLTTAGKALYVGAHPDDENTAVLAYLSLGRGVEAAYLSLNRGEGGQNLIGVEQGPLLGVIRTNELLAARSIDGAQQFFTRAIDFGYSKTAEESLRIWGKENVLADVTWIVRKFRPDVIITRFPQEGGGHGHHTASAILAEEAFHAAADPSRFTEQLKYVKPWQAKRVVWNRFAWGDQPPITDQEKINFVQLPVGDYSPLLGKSFTEIAGVGRSMHKSQGFGDSQDRGAYLENFKHTAGVRAVRDLFDGVDLTWNRIQGGAEVGDLLKRTYESFRAASPADSVPLLLEAYRKTQRLASDPLVAEKRDQIAEAVRSCAGIWMEAISDDYSYTPGSSVRAKLTVINRSNQPLKFSRMEIDGQPAVNVNEALANNRPVTKEIQVTIPADANNTQPYWLADYSQSSFASVSDQQMIGSAGTSAALSTTFVITAQDQTLSFTEPVFFRWVDPVRGEQYRMVEVVPDVAVNVLRQAFVFPDAQQKLITMGIRSGRADVRGQITLRLPQGWSSRPQAIPFALQNKGDTAEVTFTVKPGAAARQGNLVAEAAVGDKRFSSGIHTLDYEHIGPHTVFPPASVKVSHLNIRTIGKNIGYIMGSGDQMPESLRQLGYTVTLLNDDQLRSNPLSQFDAIVVGVRAYNTRRALPAARTNLLQYVQNGGTLIVQYQTLQDLKDQNVGPFPLRISRERVSVEDTFVKVLQPDHRLLNYPNKITPEDFTGWVQERGLYFPDQWDSKYQTIIESNDPGEPPKPGGILVTTYGKGAYVYTSYSWFRQLPAGVSGAFRIFANMIAAGSRDGRTKR